MKELNEFRGVEMEANDKKKEVGFQENTSNITLPSGCMTSNQIYVAPESDQSEKKRKNKKGKSMDDKKKRKTNIILLIIALIIGAIYMCYDLSKGKNSKNDDVSIINTEESSQDTTTEQKTQIEKITSQAIKENENAKTEELKTTTEAAENTETTTEVTANTTETTEVIPEPQNSNIGSNEIEIGGITVSYEFDNTWKTAVKDLAFSASKKTASGILSLYVTDSNIRIGKTDRVREMLGTISNPCEDAGLELVDSKSCEKVDIHGRDGYVTYYQGKDSSDNSVTSMGIIQDIGGDTYAYITIDDTFGYEPALLIENLAINVQ